jgi:hypothetical protein
VARLDEVVASGDVTAMWAESYQGEVIGEAYFAEMAELCDDPEQASTLQWLARLERTTRFALVPTMQRLGLSIEPDPDTVAVVRAAAAGDSYAAMLEATGPVAEAYLGLYRRLAGLAEVEDRPTAELLIAHEEALADFVRREQAGDRESSLHAIMALPHVRAAAMPL